MFPDGKKTLHCFLFNVLVNNKRFSRCEFSCSAGITHSKVSFKFSAF